MVPRLNMKNWFNKEVVLNTELPDLLTIIFPNSKFGGNMPLGCSKLVYLINHGLKEKNSWEIYGISEICKSLYSLFWLIAQSYF